MTNAAFHLADLLADWDVPANQMPENVRKASRTNVELWPLHARAVEYLFEIERQLAAMEAHGDVVAHFRESLPAWYRAVFAFSTPWQSKVPSSRAVIAPPELRLLRALGGHIDAVRLNPSYNDEQLSQLRQTFETAREMVQESPDLGDAGRRYLLGLVKEGLDYLNDVETFGTAPIRRISFELGGAMVVEIDKIPDAERKRAWASTTYQILINMAGGAGVVALETVVKSITS